MFSRLLQLASLAQQARKESVDRTGTEKVDSLLKKDSAEVNKGEYLKFNFGRTSFSQSAPRLRKQAIDNRVDHIVESRALLGKDYGFERQFKEAK